MVVVSVSGQADILGPGPGLGLDTAGADNMDNIDTGADNMEVLGKISFRQVIEYLFLTPISFYLSLKQS